MDFDDLTRAYFGYGELDELTPSAVAAGVDRMLVDLGREQDRAHGGARSRKPFEYWTIGALVADSMVYGIYIGIRDVIAMIR